MSQATYPVYETAEWISETDNGFRFAMVENREFSKVEHRHDFYEITVVFFGCEQHKINGVHYNQSKGTISILRPGDCHLQIRQGEEIRVCVYSVASTVIEPFLSVFDVRDRIYSTRDPIQFQINSLQLQSLYQIFEQLQWCSSQKRMDYGKIFISMVLQYFLQSNENKQLSWIERITLEMNTPENLAAGVSALQRIACLSHPQLCRVFRQTFDKTPQEFVKELRLNNAYAMICNTDEPFEIIAAKVGYTSFSHFSTIFKEYFKQTPSALRKATQKYW